MRFFIRVIASPFEVGADWIVWLVMLSECKDVICVYVFDNEIQLPHSDTHTQIVAKPE